MIFQGARRCVLAASVAFVSACTPSVGGSDKISDDAVVVLAGVANVNDVDFDGTRVVFSAGGQGSQPPGAQPEGALQVRSLAHPEQLELVIPTDHPKGGTIDCPRLIGDWLIWTDLANVASDPSSKTPWKLNARNLRTSKSTLLAQGFYERPGRVPCATEVDGLVVWQPAVQEAVNSYDFATNRRAQLALEANPISAVSGGLLASGFGADEQLAFGVYDTATRQSEVVRRVAHGVQVRGTGSRLLWWDFVLNEESSSGTTLYSCELPSCQKVSTLGSAIGIGTAVTTESFCAWTTGEGVAYALFKKGKKGSLGNQTVPVGSLAAHGDTLVYFTETTPGTPDHVLKIHIAKVHR